MSVERGKLISFEGPEGSGKSAQILRLHARMQSLGMPVTARREPGGTKIGDQIRSVLLSPENKSLVPKAELLLFQASRAQLTAEVLLPLMNEGTWILLDRFSDSTLAYQGYGRGMDLEKIRGIVEYATGGLRPDLTLLLDVDVETGLKRKKTQEEWNRMDALTWIFTGGLRPDTRSWRQGNRSGGG